MKLAERTDTLTAPRLTRSAQDRAGAMLSTGEVADWLAERRAAHRFRVDRIALDELRGWSFAPSTGNLVHASGRFFSVEGLRVRSDECQVDEWYQPIIRQPEVGILGILVKEFDGVPHLLMQAKMEPGNPGLLQLSPTVQATRSNYTGAHRGADVKYIDYFRHPARGTVLADVIQSEHGSWFFHKGNRNMIVEAHGEVPYDPGFRWLTLGQLGELMRQDNLVNMDSRTVLACAPFFDEAEPRALHSDAEVISWLTAQRATRQLRVDRVPLNEVRGWTRDGASIRHDADRYFRVVGVSVQAGSREVSSWTQPLFEPVGLGVTAFLTRRIAGVTHLLAHAKAEGGVLQSVELGPTVQCVPANYDHLPPPARPRFLDLVREADPSRIRYEAIHSEEGGRFLNAESRYMIIEATEEEAPLNAPPGYRWVTPAQLSALTQHGNYVNVQGRTLLACQRFAL
ncbi:MULTISPECIES: NDP-hexose 2,3-dehydratase family protein [unclassified Streptomyces]|uniref:NDP-hexose 2,3-dehydratase family protein n=1 Tax=unclassified Streptomyces TaxID=2593676 RepID=UPI00381B9A44